MRSPLRSASPRSTLIQSPSPQTPSVAQFHGFLASYAHFTQPKATEIHLDTPKYTFNRKFGATRQTFLRQPPPTRSLTSRPRTLRLLKRTNLVRFLFYMLEIRNLCAGVDGKDILK